MAYTSIHRLLLLLIASHTFFVNGCTCGRSTSGTNNMLSVDGSYNLLTISCMEGKQQSCIMHFDINSHFPSKGYLVVIGLPNQGGLSPKKWKDDLSKKVIGCIGNGVQKLWDKDGTFIVLHKVDKAGKQSFSVELEEARNLLRHHLYLMPFDPKMPNKQVDYDYSVKLEGDCSPLPDYTNIGLQAKHAIKEERAGQVKWRLQGSIDAGYSIQDPSEVGFLLVEEKADVDPWHLVQKRIINGASASGVDGVMMVPGRLSLTDHLITSDGCDFPPKGKLFAYLRQGNHYYIGQMQYLLSNVMDEIAKEQTPPPAMSDYSLKLPKLQITLHDGDVAIKGLDIDFLINGAQTKSPADVKSCLLVQKKETQASLSDLDCNRVATLFKELQLGQNSCISKDGQFCLIVNNTQKLDRLSLPFFSPGHAYEFFICGFSEKNKSLQYYTHLDSKSVTITETCSCRSHSDWSSYSTRPAQKVSATELVVNGQTSRTNSKNLNGVIKGTQQSSDSTVPSRLNAVDVSQIQNVFFTTKKCDLNGTLFEKNTNTKGIICVVNKDFSQNELAEQVSQYLKKSAGQNDYKEDGIFVFQHTETNTAEAALGARPDKFYHWFIKPDKKDLVDVELCQGHDFSSE